MSRRKSSVSAFFISVKLTPSSLRTFKGPLKENEPMKPVPVDFFIMFFLSVSDCGEFSFVHFSGRIKRIDNFCLFYFGCKPNCITCIPLLTEPFPKGKTPQFCFQRLNAPQHPFPFCGIFRLLFLAPGFKPTSY